MSDSGPAIPAPLDHDPMSSLRYFDRIVLRCGLELNRSSRQHDPDTWEALGDNGFEKVESQIVDKLLGVGIASVAVRDVWGDRRWFGVSRSPGPVLTLRWQQLQEEAYTLLPAQVSQLALNVIYVLGAVLHHFSNLATLYSEVTRRYFDGHPFARSDSDRVILSGEVDPYYEVEALITAATRSFETIRYVLWNGYGSGHDTPRKFESVMNAVKLPAKLSSPSVKWLERYLRLRDYRDCLLHNAHFGARLPFSMANRIEGYWGLLNRLPDNPETKSYEQFSYDENIDALEYGWSLTNDVFDMTYDVFQALGEGAA